MPRVTFIQADGSRRDIDAKAGLTLLEIAQDHDIDIEGACDGSMACSTCHVIVDPLWYARLPAISEEEADILDLAWGLAATSRLGCQIALTDELDGLVVRLPELTHSLIG